MNNELLALVLLLELILAISTAAPLGLSGRFARYPNLGIAIWFLLIATSFLAALAAIAIAFASVFVSYFNLQAGADIGETLLVSFAPWILLAFAGVLLAITNLRLTPYFEGRDQKIDLSRLAKNIDTSFQGVSVRELEVPGYVAITQSRVIYLSSAALGLDKTSLEAILWHEYGHIRLGHHLLKTVSSLALIVAPWFLVSRVFSFEIQRLCELAADRFALKHVSRVALTKARRLFL